MVRLETTHDRKGALDGAWWPRSRDIAGELPGLVSALSEYLGPITRVGLDTDAWDELPTRLTIDGRVVRIDSFPVGDDTVLITRGSNDLFSLLVVPPHTAADAARAAMAAAVRAAVRRRRNRSSSTPARSVWVRGMHAPLRYATAAMSRAADDALVGGGTTRRSQRPAV